MSKTFRLFKMLPCFLLGVATVLDMGATMDIYNMDKHPYEADSKALRSDWEVTGNDICAAINEYGKSNE